MERKGNLFNLFKCLLNNFSVHQDFIQIRHRYTEYKQPTGTPSSSYYFISLSLQTALQWMAISLLQTEDLWSFFLQLKKMNF